MIATEESIRVSSSTAIAYETVSPPAPPYCSGIGRPMQAQLPELRDELVGETAGQVELFRDGCDPLSRERPDRVANQLLLGSQVEVHAARMVSAR